MSTQGHLYFHAPCFDGLVCAVLLSDFLEADGEWSESALHGVNYNIRDEWLALPLQKPAAVVDFLYHNLASFWADHHATTFLTDEVRQDFENRQSRRLVYDETADSCASLLWRHLCQCFGYRNERYSQLIVWADKIDAARYESAYEAIFSDAPAVRINMSFFGDQLSSYCESLVRALRLHTLDEVANIPEVRRRCEDLRSRTNEGIKRLKENCKLEADDIAVFDVEEGNTQINRYAPYFLFPGARYSAGVIRRSKGATVTAMRNPWREFRSAHLGQICARLGGGGHQRVGSVVLRGAGSAEATLKLQSLLTEIRKTDQLMAETPND